MFSPGQQGQQACQDIRGQPEGQGVDGGAVVAEQCGDGREHVDPRALAAGWSNHRGGDPDRVPQRDQLQGHSDTTGEWHSNSSGNLGMDWQPRI